MEVDDIHCNFPNGSRNLADVHKMDEEDDGDRNKTLSSSSAAVDLGRLYGWPSSRIVRVSRASGGKDRHSKVLTSKGLRDRRVRLSVNTAIQFYDLQDRLGYDQPSKAVEWLLKAAAASIAELPPMSNPFPQTPKQLSDEKRSSTDHLCFETAEVDMDGGRGGGGDPRFVTKSSGAACSSTSETSKGSGLSLTRSESRIKARERAKGRVAEKEKDSESPHVAAGSFNPILHTTSFTELLSGGMNQNHNNNNNTIDDGGGGGGRHWSSTPMDYFTSGLLARPPQMHLQAGNPFTFGVTAEQHHQELQHISFLSDLGNHHHHHHHHHNGDYNLNFTISSSSAENSSGLPGFSRGTLQSNNSSPPQSSMLPQLQRYTNTNNINSDGSSQGFYMGTTASPVENHRNQFPTGYEARYGNKNNNNGQKGKGKN